MTLYNAIDGTKRQVDELSKQYKNLQIARTRYDFLVQLKDCVNSIGGNTNWINLETTLGELCDTLAQNGLTFTTIEVDIDG